MDETEGEGILGDQFQNELMYLDTLEKKRIKVYICSPGGDVMDAMKMYQAILATKTKVDTYNGGVAASSAGFVFQAGRTRYMSDYALLMMHNPSGATDEANSPALTAFKDSIVKMLSRKCSLEESQVSDMMNNTTWPNAEQSKEMGFCDVVENSADMNKPRAVSVPTDVKATWKQYCNYFNSLYTNKSQPTMKKVTNFLKLNDAASEENILQAIEAIQNKVTTAEAAQKTAEDNLKTKETELAAEKTKVTNLETEVQGYKTKEADATKKAKEDAAELAVTNLVKEGKVKNDATIIASVKEQFVNNFDGTKKIYDAMPLNRTAAKVDNVDLGAGGAKGLKNTMAGVMAEIAAKNKQI